MLRGRHKIAPVLQAVNKSPRRWSPSHPHLVQHPRLRIREGHDTTRPRHNVVIRLADGCDGGIAISGQANICRANFLDWFGILGDRDRTGGLRLELYELIYLQPYPNYWAMIDDIKWFAVDKTACNDSAGWVAYTDGVAEQQRLWALTRCILPSVALLHSPSDALVRRGCRGLPEERWPS